MSIEIKAPTFPESVAEGEVATWHKQPGEAVKRDELIVDIETDKVVLEVVATQDGVISEVLKKEGDIVQSNEVIGQFEAGAEASSAPTSAPEKTEPEPKAEPAAPAVAEVNASPAARKLISEMGLDANQINGSGKGGLITKEDVMNHGKAAPAAAPQAPADTGLSSGADRTHSKPAQWRSR